MRRHRHVTLALIAVLACCLLGVAAPTPARANGTCSLGIDQHVDGTIDDPIRIATKADLIVLATDPLCYAAEDVYLQTADIDLGGTPWTPIAYAGPAFGGTYDGGGHRITGLLVNETSAPAGIKGLFAAVSSATITRLEIDGARVEGGVSGYAILAADVENSLVSDITIRDSTIVENDDGEQNYGAVAGYAWTATIERVLVDGIDIVTADGVAVAPANAGGVVGTGSIVQLADVEVARGSIHGSTRVGGVGGRLICSRMERVTVGDRVTVHGGGNFVGGAVGDVRNAECAGIPTIVPGVVDTSSAAAVTGAAGVGGLIGQADVATVSRSSASGAATATGGEAGGLIGRAAASTLADVYALGPVTASGSAGGLIGAVVADPSDSTSVTRAYAAGRVAAGATASAGGLLSGATFDCILGIGISGCAIGSGGATVTDSFWDAASTGQTSTHGGGTPRTTTQMRQRTTFAAAGWSIADGRPAATAATWGICTGANGGRPFLQSQSETITGACHRALVVVSTRTAGNAIVTRVRVGGPAVLRQHGTRVSPASARRAVRAERIVCRAAAKRPTRAGVVTLRCVLNRAARRALRTHDLRVRVVTRIVPADGLPVVAERVVVVPRAPGPAPVTG